MASILAASLIIAACGTEEDGDNDPGNGGSNPPEEMEEVSVRLAWLLRAYDMGMVVALDKGFYEEEGLEVTINEGEGDSIAGELVSNGSATFATVDATTGADLISKGANIRYVAVILQTHPCSTISYPESQIREPSDLVGKQGGVSAAGACRILLQAVFGKHGIDEADVPMTNMDPGVKQNALLENRVEWIHGFVTGDYLVVTQQNPDIVAVPYSDWDVNALSEGIVVHPDTIENDPELVQRFVRATMKGYEYANANKEEAADIGIRHFPEGDRDALLAGLELQEPLMFTSTTEGQPLGWMAEEDWRQTVDLMYDFGESEEPLELDTYFTNEFIEGAS